jgi:hypothetical protein
MAYHRDRFEWIFHHPAPETQEKLVAGARPELRADDDALISRALRAFRATDPKPFHEPASWPTRAVTSENWLRFAATRQDALLQTLTGGSLDDAARVLRNPHENYLYYGFENLFADREGIYRDPVKRERHARHCKDMLVRLAEAIGAISLENPEGGQWGRNMTLTTADLVSAIEERVGVALPLPDVHYGYCGLRVDGGFISASGLTAYYCAFRAMQLTRLMQRPRMVEIGGGLGYLARFAFLMGCRDFTILDLPLTNLCQAYYLLRTVGPDRVVLAGEAARSGDSVIRVLPPNTFDELESVDLVVNVDGITEYGEDIALTYLQKICRLTPVMMSVNHEVNAYRFRDLVMRACAVRSFQRFPYWLRNGYVEEIVEFA